MATKKLSIDWKLLEMMLGPGERHYTITTDPLPKDAELVHVWATIKEDRVDVNFQIRSDSFEDDNPYLTPIASTQCDKCGCSNDL